MAKAFSNTLVSNTCGVGLSSMFRKNTQPGGGTSIKLLENMGGADWHIASFIKAEAEDDLAHSKYNDAYKEAYKEFRDKWQIVFQGRCRVNRRTNNKFILVVYDTKVPKAEVDNSKYKWPALME
jgi:hypothetical protein